MRLGEKYRDFLFRPLLTLLRKIQPSEFPYRVEDERVLAHGPHSLTNCKWVKTLYLGAIEEYLAAIFGEHVAIQTRLITIQHFTPVE